MRRNLRRAAVLLSGVAIVAVVPAVANAVTVYQGDDRAYNDGYTRVNVCDGETDGHSVYSNYTDNGTNGRIEVFNGNGWCTSAATTGLVKFRVCENVPFATDPCSSYVYP